MGLTVNTNIASINAQRNLGIANAQLATSLERLSSGLRINRASDDAAGLAIATKLNAQVRGLQQAARNAGNAISLVQTAEGGFGTATNILQRLRELAVQSASDDNTASDRQTLNAETKQLREELTRLATVTQFNGASLLTGNFSGKKFQVGANSGQTISFSLSDSRAQALGKFASVAADVGDGASSGVNGSGALTSGEFTINGTNVLATSATDDQVSVLVVGGAAKAESAVLSAGKIIINKTSFAISTLKALAATDASAATNIVAGINGASITDVTARVVDGSFVVLEVANGTDLTIQASGATAASFLGISAAFLGSDNVVATTTNGQSSAIAKAAAVNAVSGTTTVEASVTANTVTFTNTVAIGGVALAGGDLVINGVDVGSVTVLANDADGALVAAINAQSSVTGVTASLSQGKLTISAADGRNISVVASTGAKTALGNVADITFTGNAGLVRSSFDLKSTDNIVIGGSTIDIGSIVATTYVASGNLSNLDISTQANATNAILQLDSALDQINSQRADIGAVQSRIQNTIDYLNVAAENQAAAESRIRDADFALETAKFTRAQILTQAATAILAQANAAPQVALQLLQ